MRIFHEAIGQHRDVHQPVLMHTDVDEGSEVGDIGHGAFQDHAGLQILQGLDALLELRGLELGTRVAAGFLQLGQNVFHGRQTETLVGEGGRIEPTQGRGVADQTAHILAGELGDAPHHWIGFRMHRRSVERLLATGDTQKARALLERLVAETRHSHQFLAAYERAIGLAEGDDVLGQTAVESRDLSEQRHRGGIEIHADRVHAVLDHGVQGARQPRLVDVVLILTDTDRLGLDLDQFGERILQPARDRDRAAQRDIQLGQFLRGELRGRIDRGARLVDDERFQPQLGMARDQVASELIGLARGGAVADADELDVMRPGQLR